ncbi:MAG: hypothetical protein EBR82_71790 [Caulobacteraceae bacterium]|nr:hypothetical protein [Caulobacteraceae bacterium]
MTHDVAGPSVAHNTSMAVARLSAANTWLQEEIKRLRLTDAEREAIADAAGRYVEGITPKAKEHASTLRGLLERLG